MKNYLIISLLFILFFSGYSQKYQNFKVSIYCRVFEVKKMGDTANYLIPAWNEITRQLKVDKVYLETHRDMELINQDTLDIVKEFFIKRNIEIAGGITYTIKESNNFQTFCYNNSEHRKKVREIAEFTAKNFNEFILDDFFFTSCKSDGAIKDKGDRSWTDYRLDLMKEAAQTLILQPAKKLNPDVKVIIKYPNWYAHFQGLGFNLEEQPLQFDGIYTGTETRDAKVSAQHLQPYLGYNIFRYFENIAPGKNGGGWVDPFGMGYYDRYAEQLWITAFAKAPEITLFHFGQLTREIDSTYISSWQGQNTSFDFDEMMLPVNYNNEESEKPSSLARVAGYSFEKADEIMGFTGNPIGIKSYKPYHSRGEDFLQNFFGMIGLPIDMVPYFPANEQLILLTESAKFDNEIISKIKNQLVDGKTVIITSGLLRVLQDKGLSDIVELRYTDRKSIVNEYTTGRYQLEKGDKPVLIPQIEYYTNDSWEIVSGISGANGWPILHMADYSKGKLFVLTIPDNFADLYNLPYEVLNKIRQVICSDLDVSLEAPANISIFLYDNNTFIIESFLDEPVDLIVLTDEKFPKITDLKTNDETIGELRTPMRSWRGVKSESKNVFNVNLKPHSFRIFRYEE